MMTGFLSFLGGGGPAFSPWILGYLDPGSGSMLFQVLIAGLLSSLFCVRSSYLRLKDTVFGNHDRA
jgi:hypothetical protein